MPKAVIFDVDGTLLDSVDGHAQSWVDAFREYGHDIPFAVMRPQIGKGGDTLMPEFLQPGELQQTGKALEERRGVILKERYLPQFKPFPDAAGLLRAVRERGIRVALASSAKEDELQEYKRIIGIEGLADVETTSDDAQNSKPAPDIFAAALKKLGLPASDAVVVGDTPYDAQAARKAGLRCVGVTCGGWSEAALREAGCEAVYQDPADLLRQLGTSPLVAS